MMTYAIIIANAIVFIITIAFRYEMIYGLGFRPIYLSIEYSPQMYTLFTSQFIHSAANPWHIIGNMLILFFVGMALEERIGRKKFLIIYLLTGAIAAIAHSLINLGSTITLIGASGAIFGIMGALVFSYPRDEVVMPIPAGFIMIIRRIKVIYAVLIFIAFETFLTWISIDDNTAHFAHFGGLLGGFILAALLIRRRKAGPTESLKPTYYDSYAPQKPGKVDYSNLRKLANTPELKEMLQKIENETIPQARDIWLEHFLEKTKCPKCGKNLNHFDRKIWCDNCGFKTKI
jgi:membrane associated rhomboid family serine protease